jgi:hypothetical protein
MKKLFFAILSFVVVSAQAQTVDEVIQKYAAAIGGLDAFNKVKTAKFTGTYSTQGVDLAMTIQTINGKATRSDIDYMGQTITSVYKDGKGWTINPLAGSTTATDLEGSQLNDLKMQSILANQLMDYKARGHQVVLAGQEEVDGIKTFKIALTNKDDGKTTNYYLDASTYMLIKSVATRELMGQDIEVETFYSNIKEINGLKFSANRVQKVEGQVLSEAKFDKVELDIPIDEKIFNKQ